MFPMHPIRSLDKGTTAGHLYLTSFSTGHGKEPKPKSKETQAAWRADGGW